MRASAVSGVLNGQVAVLFCRMPSAVVNGELRFEREVELFVHTSAKIGSVSGATAKSYTDSIPARRDD